MQESTNRGGLPSGAQLYACVILLGSALLLAQSVAAFDDNPIIDYQFDGTLTDGAGGSSLSPLPECPTDPAAPCNSLTGFGTDADGSFWEWESTNGNGGGFSLSTSTVLGDTYSLRLRLKFDSVASYRKIIDFKDRASDNGLYFLSGDLVFYRAGAISGNGEDIAANEFVDILLIRDGGSNQVDLYLFDGTRYVLALSFEDDTSEVVAVEDSGGSLLRFFHDDAITSSEGSPGGQVYSLEIWDRVLVPEVIFSDRFEQSPTS